MRINKKNILILFCVAIFILMFSSAYAQVSDFGGYRPHYQGFGTDTSGGRGGKIIKVTNLNDAGAGSLREALEPSVCGPRFVIFEISGRIKLKKQIDITCPYLTVAGQTAPSPGIMITDKPVIVDTHDVILQHLHIRQGKEGDEGYDQSALYLRNNIKNVVLDHMSISWSLTSTTGAHDFPADGDWSKPWGLPPQDVAFLDSIFAEGIVNYARTPPHPAVGTLFYGQNGRKTATLARNLWVHFAYRTPWFSPGWNASIYNNLAYNNGVGQGVGNEKDAGAGGFFQIMGSGYTQTWPIHIAYVNNVNLAGPQTHPDVNGVKISQNSAQAAAGWTLYLSGNIGPRMTPSNQWAGVTYCWIGCGGVEAAKESTIRTDTPQSFHTNFNYGIMPASQVQNYVLANAGARPLDRDVVDARLVQDPIQKDGGFITSEKDVGGYPVYTINIRPLTTPSNPNAIAPGQAFRTNIEMWLEDYARALEPANVAPIILPTISTFISSQTSIAPGQSSTLNWTTNGATSVSIDNGIGSVSASGSKTISPSITTTYTLTATNSAGSITKTVTITVAPKPADYGGYRPHYQGYGIETPGGRGGEIRRVTNLNDAGAGSFREAVAPRPGCDNTPAKCARIVVFETSGTIELNNFLRIDSPYFTIAGQTAPSPGITIHAQNSIRLETHDVVIQHVRIRRGDESASDGAQSALWARNDAFNIVIDHSSFSWGTDETLTFWAANGNPNNFKNVSVLDSMITEALSDSKLNARPHSTGTIYGPSQDGTLTFARNLMAHNNNRNPWFTAIGRKVSGFNNVAYNAGGGAGDPGLVGFLQIVGDSDDGAPSPTEVAWTGNVAIPGINTHPDTKTVKVYLEKGFQLKLYLSDNTGPHMTLANQWDGVTYCQSGCAGNTATESSIRINNPPVWHTSFNYNILPNGQVQDHVFANAGARPKDRDPVDARIVKEVKTRTGKIVNCVGPTTTLKQGETDAQMRVRCSNNAGGWSMLAVNKRAYVTPANPNGPGNCGTTKAGVVRTNLECDLENMARELEPGSVPISNPTVPSPNISLMDPVAHYKFSELSGTTAADSSGLNNHATLLNGATFTSGPLGDNILNLDGVNDIAKVSQTTGLNFNQALTITALVRPQALSATAYNTVVMKGDQTTRGYGMNIYQGKLNFVKLGGADVRSTVAVTPGAWQRLTITYNQNSGTTQFWVNDVMEHSVIDTAPMNSPTDSDPLLIGSWLTGDRSFFNGQIDEIRIYPRVLSSSEIKALPMPSSAPPSNLGDLNNDNKVDLLDVMLVLKDFGKTSGFDVKHDINKDNVVNILDVVEIIKNWK